jgi:RimJ/RimL family protein N-acetyltransferase
MEQLICGGAATLPVAASTEMDYENFARLCLDPVRLAALGRSAEDALSVEVLMAAMDVPRRTALETIAALRLSGLTDADDRLLLEALRDVAATLPKPEEASPAITEGDWTPGEIEVLRSQFSGERLVEIPTQRRKRLVVLERLAQDFEPGVRYNEAEVSAQLQRYHDDYAALRRYMVEESLMTRSDGIYWRTGGRFPAEDATSLPAAGDARLRDPILATQDSTVELAPYSALHRPGLLTAANDERITQFMTDQFPYPYTEEDADAWIAACEAQDPPRSFAILVDGHVAGGVGCEPMGDIRTGTAEVGWWVAPRWWGRGVATAAVRRYIDYCFDDLDLHRLEAGVFLSNPASVRVAEKAGFELEGIGRDAYQKRGELFDRLSYGLTRARWYQVGDAS